MLFVKLPSSKQLAFQAFVFCLMCLAWPHDGEAQTELTAVPFIQIEPTAEAMMTGGAASALPSLHPVSFFYNPALLGYIGRHQAAAISGFYREMDWLSHDETDMAYSHFSLAGGFNLDRHLGIPLAVGIGYLRGKISYRGHFYHATENFDMVGIGFQLDYPVRVSLGLSRKHVMSGPFYIGEQQYAAELGAYDTGLLVEYSHRIGPLQLGVSASQVIRNVGGRVRYRPSSPSDVLPRTAVWGYALSGGYDVDVGGIRLRFIEADWTLEASDILAEISHEDPPWRQVGYTRWPGNLSFGKHLVLGRDDDQVTVRRGYRIHLLETVTIGYGRFKGPDYPVPIRTNGYTMSSTGLFKILSANQKNDWISRIGERVMVSYHRARLSASQPYNLIEGRLYQEVTVSWRFF